LAQTSAYPRCGSAGEHLFAGFDLDGAV